MKRFQLFAILALALISLGGCFLVLNDPFHTTIDYQAFCTGGGTMDVTYRDDQGNFHTDYSQLSGWSRTYTVDNGNNYLAYARATANFGTTGLTVTILADGAMVTTQTNDPSPSETWASYLVE